MEAWKVPVCSTGWMQFASIVNLLSEENLAALLDEGEHLCKLLAQSVLTAKSRRFASPDEPPPHPN
jgi:hypothetical protein